MDSKKDRDEIKTDWQNLEVCFFFLCGRVREENLQGGEFTSPQRQVSWFGCYLWNGRFIIGSQCLPFILLKNVNHFLRVCSESRYWSSAFLREPDASTQPQAWLAGCVADGLCLPQMPLPSDSCDALLWHLFPIQHKGTSNQAQSYSQDFGLFSVLVSRGADYFSLKPSRLSEHCNNFFSVTREKEPYSQREHLLLLHLDTAHDQDGHVYLRWITCHQDYGWGLKCAC